MRFRVCMQVGRRRWWEEHDVPRVQTEDDARRWSEDKLKRQKEDRKYTWLGCLEPQPDFGPEKVLVVESLDVEEENDW